jgi:opacity protein-like surface antigen
MFLGTQTRVVGVTAGLALAVSAFAGSAAQAMNCAPFPGGAGAASILAAPGNSAAAVSSMIGSTIAAANTAFLLQSTAFIGSPPNPAPDQQGGGVWVRGVDGNVNIKSTTTGAAAGTGAVFGAGANMAVACSQQVDVNFGGFQVGQDISKLNYNGWNLHSGVTAGDLGAKSTLVGGYPVIATGAGGGGGVVGFPNVGGGGFVGGTHVPFIGMYAAATNGGFSVDALLRTEFYQSAIDAPVANVLNQNIDAHGWTFATSAAYQWAVPDTNWFIEPSAGLLISQTKVDQFGFLTAGAGAANSFPGILTMGTVKSDIGRLGLRFGETIESGGVVWQPFAAVSVWHEFGKDITASFSSAPGFAVTGLLAGNGPATANATTSTTTFGTYGQYSLGLAAIIEGTGWSEFIRADYRDGPNLMGWSGSGGIRYQFTPDHAPKAMPLKTKAPPPVEVVNWTGFYVGGFGGATQGRASEGYSGAAATGSVSPYIAGYLFGADVGYNWQTGPYVIGVEADWGSTHTQGGIACGPSASTGVFPAVVLNGMYQMTCNEKNNWIATATARLGYTWDRALFYVKGGGAWTKEEVSATCNYGAFNLAGALFHCTNPGGAFSNGFLGTKNVVGWDFGWGTEYALTSHWSAKGEADYISFGKRTIVANDPVNGPTPISTNMHIWEEKIGVNYKF